MSKFSRIVKIFRQPEEVEIPRRVAEKFCKHQAPALADPEQVDPTQGLRGCNRLVIGIFFARRGFFNLWRAIRQRPPTGPKQTESAGTRKTISNSNSSRKCDQRRRNNSTNRRPSVDDAHRGRAFFDAETIPQPRASLRENHLPRPSPAGTGCRRASRNLSPARDSRRPADQKIIITVNPRRVPNASANLPPPAYIRAYEKRNADCSSENCSFESGMSWPIALMATGRVWRSR